MKKIELWYAVAALLVLAALFFAAAAYTPTPEVDLDAQLEEARAARPLSYPMEMAESEEGRVFSNEQLGFTFTLSKDFSRIGDNRLGFGTFQAFTYAEDAAVHEKWLPGQNKLEMFIIDDPRAFTTEEDAVEEVQVAGKSSYKFENSTGRFVGYIVPLPALSGKYLTFTMYGDAKNFTQLDDVIASLDFY